MWREGIGLAAIIMEKVDGGSYKNHPAVKEFEESPMDLHHRLMKVWFEAKNRGYNFDLSKLDELNQFRADQLIVGFDRPAKPWQTLEQQIEILKSKGCDCNL